MTDPRPTGEHRSGPEVPRRDPDRGAVNGSRPRALATIRVDAAGQIVGWDAGAHDVYGYTEADVLGVSLRDLTLEMSGALTTSEARGPRNEAVARSEARFRALVQHSSDLVGIVDRSLVVMYVSPSATELLGVAPSSAVGNPVVDAVHADDRDELNRLLVGVVEGTEPGRPSFDVRLLHADGEWRTFEMVATDLLSDPSIRGIVINGRDVTDRRRSDLELRHRAAHDPLTDLPNRTRFMDDLAGLLQQIDGVSADGLRHDREDHRPRARVAVVALGIDRLQTINDSLGHHAGDQVLVAAGDRLRRAVPDGAVVARVGGDTFVAAAPVATADDAHGLADQLLGALREPLQIAGRRMTVTARAGVALSGPDATAPNLLRHAGAALHRTQIVRTEPIVVFVPELGDQANRRLELEQALHHAVANDELRVHLQPIVTTDDGEPIGVEALVRWQHPTLGLVPPLDFIPLAEETGDIVGIGNWVLRRACEIVSRWNRDDRQLQLSVNLSASQFQEPRFLDHVHATLATTGFDPRLLTLEVTESVLVEEGTTVLSALAALRDLGIKLAIDDFGTGYSSLVYLRRLRVDALKIDKSFIDGLALGSDDDTIVRTIIDLASSLGLSVVAEGVETEEQRRRLLAHGCRLAQGYLFARPLEPDALVRHLLASGR